MVLGGDGLLVLRALSLLRLMILDLDREMVEGEQKSTILRRKMLEDRRFGDNRDDGVDPWEGC